MAYEWFISYRRKSGGENQARQVAEILSKYVGKDKVFYDRVSMREGNWRDQINDALNSAEHFVLLVNEASAAEDQSNNIGGYRYEIEYALNNEKKITLIEYDKKSYEEVTAKYPSLKDAQKVTFNGEYNFAFEERLCKHFGFVYQKTSSAPTVIHNIVIPENLIPRRDMLNELDNEFKSHKCVVVSGIGGSGKTSLAYLYAEKHKSDFDNREIIKIPNDLEENVISNAIASQFPEINDNLKTDLNYLISKLNQIDSNDNLLIIDIKQNSIDIKDKIESVIPKIRLNEKWKTLVLTRTYPRSIYFKTISMECLTKEEAIDIFKIHFKDKRFTLKEEYINNMVERLCYHPMLIVAASTFYNNSHHKLEIKIYNDLTKTNITNNELIRNEVLFSQIKGDDNPEKSLYEYLINLFNIDDTEKKVLAYYLTLPDMPLEYDTIMTLLQPEFNDKILSSLEGKGILYRDMDTDQYTMHNLIKVLLHEHIIDYSYYFANIKKEIETNPLLDTKEALSIVNSLFYKELGSITERIDILHLIIEKNDKKIFNSHYVEINKVYDKITVLLNKLKDFRTENNISRNNLESG